MGEHSYKHVSWMKWRLHLGGITPQWFQLKLYRLDWSLWASELVLAVQQALSFQGAHCSRARDGLVREDRQQLEGVRGCCRCQVPAQPTTRSVQQQEHLLQQTLGLFGLKSSRLQQCGVGRAGGHILTRN